MTLTMVIDHSNMNRMKPDAETISISAFKATCLARLERVRRTGRRLLVTKRGTPIAEVVPATVERSTGGWLGSASGTGRITGDLVGPVVATDEWEAAR
jgi:prevent-host-death family protein